MIQPSMPKGSNRDLSITIEALNPEPKKGWFGKSSVSRTITIRDEKTRDVSYITIKGKDSEEVEQIITAIRDAVSTGSRMNTTEGVLRHIKNEMMNTCGTNLVQNKKIATMFSKALDKRGSYTSSREFLDGIEEHKSKQLAKLKLQPGKTKEDKLRDLDKAMKAVQRNPHSKEAWGKFYALMEVYNTTPEGITLLHNRLYSIRNLLAQGVELARQHKVSSAEVGAIHIHTFASDVDIANNMERTFVSVSSKLMELDTPKIGSEVPSEPLQRENIEKSSQLPLTENEKAAAKTEVVTTREAIQLEREAIRREKEAAQQEADEILNRNASDMQKSLDVVYKKLQTLKQRKKELDAQEDQATQSSINISSAVKSPKSIQEEQAETGKLESSKKVLTQQEQQGAAEILNQNAYDRSKALNDVSERLRGLNKLPKQDQIPELNAIHEELKKARERLHGQREEPETNELESSKTVLRSKALDDVSERLRGLNKLPEQEQIPALNAIHAELKKARKGLHG